MDEQTIKTYNKMSEEYDNETAEFWQKFPSEIINQFVKQLKTNAEVLDVGSGPGRDGLILKKEA